MQLSLNELWGGLGDFWGIGELAAHSGLFPFIIALIVVPSSFLYLFRILREYLNSPDSVSAFAQKTMRENDSIMSDLKRKEKERSGR